MNKLYRFQDVINELKHKASGLLCIRKEDVLIESYFCCVIFNYRCLCTLICILNFSSDFLYPHPQWFLKYCFQELAHFIN